MAVTKVMGSSKCMYELRTHKHCWWECKMVQALSKIIWQFLKMLALVTLGTKNSASTYISKGTEDTLPHKNMYMSVHSSIVHHQQV